VKVMKALVELGANVEAKTAGGRTPLHVAAVSGQVESIKLLVQLGVNKEANDDDGWTALHHAACSGHVEAIKVLVQLGVNKEAKTANGATPLHQAGFNGNVEAIKLLVQLGVDKEAKDVHGWTPLHYAAVKEQVEAIKALVDLGVQVDAQAANRETPLQLSVRLGHHQAAQLLRQLERAARTQKAAETSERAQQAAEQADRNAAALIEEEEREQAAKAQSKVRGVELAPVSGVSDAVSLSHGWVVSSEVPAASLLWCRLFTHCVVCSGGWVAAEGQAAEGQGAGQWRRRWRAVQQGGGGGEQQRRGEHVAWKGQPPQHATIKKRWPPQHGGGCSAARAPFRGGRERCAADAAPACWRRQEGEGATTEGAAEASAGWTRRSRRCR
jgi:hypothetical protein